MSFSVKISIIIPVFNTAEYLPQCIDSLLNQSLSDMELIFVDNGSTDGSFEILNKYAAGQGSTRLKVFQFTGGRQGRCRNFGIQEATGEYIGFCDSDDWCEPTMFEKLYTKAIKHNSEICFGQVVYSDLLANKQHAYYETKYFKEGIYNTYEKPYLTRMTSSCNKIFLRSLLLDNKITFIEGIVHQDVTFNYQALFHGENICADSSAIYYYRQHAESTTKKIKKVASTPRDDVMQMISELRRIEIQLECNAQWHAASNRLIEAHLSYLIHSVETPHIKHYLEKLLGAAGYIPHSVFLRLKANARPEILGNDLYAYVKALRHFQPEKEKKLDKYKSNLKKVMCFAIISLVINIGLVLSLQW